MFGVVKVTPFLDIYCVGEEKNNTKKYLLCKKCSQCRLLTPFATKGVGEVWG